MTYLPEDIKRELDWLKAARNDDSVSASEWQSRGNALMANVPELSPKAFSEFNKLFSELLDQDTDEDLLRQVKAELQKPASLDRVEDRIEKWNVGSLSISLPALEPAMSLSLSAALKTFREAELKGFCGCGAVGKVRDRVYLIDHAFECAASDHKLRPALQTYWESTPQGV